MNWRTKGVRETKTHRIFCAKHKRRNATETVTLVMGIKTADRELNLVLLSLKLYYYTIEVFAKVRKATI